jgi:hypothetical protein
MIDSMDKKIGMRENLVLGQTEACKENSEKISKKVNEILDILNDKQNLFLARHMSMINATNGIIQSIFNAVRSLEIEMVNMNKKVGKFEEILMTLDKNISYAIKMNAGLGWDPVHGVRNRRLSGVLFQSSQCISLGHYQHEG